MNVLDIYPPDAPPVWERARGKWKSILMSMGVVDSKTLSGKDVPCPICGGKDRFRFQDKGEGYFHCRGCGTGDGIELVARLKGCSRGEARRLVEPHVGGAKFEAPRASTSNNDGYVRKLWSNGLPLNGVDVVCQYLRSRGIDPSPLWPSLRFLDNYKHEDGSHWPVMLAKFDAPHDSRFTLHRTWLAKDGTGKAPVSKPRMLTAGPVPAGGAVRLGMAAEHIGVAEGIENALRAAQLHNIPVWSALSSGGLIKFEPPPECKRLYIFADQDEHYVGQMAAYSLANRLSIDKKRYVKVDVCLPWFHDEGVNDDWNNVR